MCLWRKRGICLERENAFLLTSCPSLLLAHALAGRETEMSFRKLALVTICAFGAAASRAAPVTAYAAKPDMKMLDPDGDGTVSMDEAKAAAEKKFVMLDADKDGTVDMKEAKGLVSKAGFKQADPDKDGTIDKTEYMTQVEAAFKMTDKDGDGTVDAKELMSPSGKTLLKMIQ